LLDRGLTTEEAKASGVDLLWRDGASRP